MINFISARFNGRRFCFKTTGRPFCLMIAQRCTLRFSVAFEVTKTLDQMLGKFMKITAREFLSDYFIL